jgi:gamma-glutamyl phosphate reductase
MASNLIDYSKEILQANKRDLEEATKEGNIYIYDLGRI